MLSFTSFSKLFINSRKFDIKLKLGHFGRYLSHCFVSDMSDADGSIGSVICVMASNEVAGDVCAGDSGKCTFQK